MFHARSSRTFALSLHLQGGYWHRAFCVNPELKLIGLQSWFCIHPLLQKLHQFSRIMCLCTHYCTPVGELIRCVPAAKYSLSDKLHWETAVAVVWDSFGNPTVYVGPNLLSFVILQERECIACDNTNPITATIQIQSQMRLHSKLYKVTLVPFANEMLPHLNRKLLFES